MGNNSTPGTGSFNSNWAVGDSHKNPEQDTQDHLSLGAFNTAVVPLRPRHLFDRIFLSAGGTHNADSSLYPLH